jgi:tRNA 2-thiouridine synthesizing protein A
MEDTIMAIKFNKKEDGVFTLDCKGYVCPHPQIYTKKMLEKIGSGDILEVIFDNPSSSESITEMFSGSGNQLIDKNVEDGQYIYRIKKG